MNLDNLKPTIEKELGSVSTAEWDFAKVNTELEVKMKYSNFGLTVEQARLLDILANNIEFARARKELIS